VAGLKFLSKKSFNPQNLVNQKSVWERKQESIREAARLRERERQLTIERDHEELAKSRDGASGGHKATLRFMYDAPPGLDGKKSTDDPDGDDGKIRSEGADASRISFQRKSGDDDAAAAFRRMLAGASSQTEEVSQHHGGDGALDEEFQSNDPSSSSLIISGSMAEATAADRSQLSQLEKAVGKRNGSSALTFEEQISRFPQLKNAPIALTRKGGDTGGDDADIVKTNMNFKPLGAQIRNVKCLACKIWGHSRGDRECKLSGWDPFSSTSIGGGANAAGSAVKPSSSIMPDSSRRKDDTDEKYGYYGPTGHKRTDGHDDRDSEDESRDSRDRRTKKKKKIKRRKDSRRDRDDRKKSRRRRRSHESDDNDSFSDQGSYSSDESNRGRKRDRKRRKHKSRRRSRSRSPYSSDS